MIIVLMRQAEIFFGLLREVFPVHRLDREVSELMLIARNKEAAARLSVLFQRGLIVKNIMLKCVGSLLNQDSPGL